MIGIFLFLTYGIGMTVIYAYSLMFGTMALILGFCLIIDYFEHRRKRKKQE